MQNLAVKNNTDITIAGNGDAFISQTKVAELCGVTRQAISKHVAAFGCQYILNEISQLDDKSAFLVVAHYAATQSKAVQSLINIGQAGMKAFIYNQAGYLMTAEKQPKIPQTYIQALEAYVGELKAKEAAEVEVKKLNTLLDKEFGYCSILRAATYLGVHETTFKWQALKARTIQLGYEVKRVPSPRYGYQNLYHLTAFKECYPEFDFDELTPELVDDKAKLTILKSGVNHD